MSSPRKPLIVIGAPVYGTVVPEILEDWMLFAFHCGRRMPEYDFELAIKIKSEQFRARNAIVEAAIQANADYLLMMDDDMIINIARIYGEQNVSYGFLDRLVKHDKDICGVLYYQRQGEMQPVLMASVASGGYRFLRDDEIKGGLQQVDVAGGGCLLVKMRVFDKVLPPFFDAEHKYGTDIQLCKRAADAGFEIWADTSIEFGHVREERAIVTSRNRHQFMTQIVSGETRRFLSGAVYSEVINDAEAWTGFHRDDFGQVGSIHLNMYETVRPNMESDKDWYSRYPKERVARQIWFNTESEHKRAFTEYILSTVRYDEPLRILDFGCGIGIPAFTFAQHGHRVTAMDFPDTGTYEFLKWRAEKHKVNLEFKPATGDIPDLNGDGPFDVIVAMDCLEHIVDWKGALKVLVDHLRPKGVLFSNNAILDDDAHPEHYHLSGSDFLKECASLGLIPMNQISYVKR